MSKINITNLRRPELPTGTVMVSASPGPNGTVGNTSGAGVLSLPINVTTLLEEEQWNELFGNSREFTGDP